MSQRALSWVLGHSETEGALRLALTVLANAAESEEPVGRMRPKTLAEQARIPADKVRVVLELLVKSGELQYDFAFGRRRRTFKYRISGMPTDYHRDLIQPADESESRSHSVVADEVEARQSRLQRERQDGKRLEGRGRLHA